MCRGNWFQMRIQECSQARSKGSPPEIFEFLECKRCHPNICFRLILHVLISLQSVFSIFFFCYSLKFSDYSLFKLHFSQISIFFVTNFSLNNQRRIIFFYFIYVLGTIYIYKKKKHFSLINKPYPYPHQWMVRAPAWSEGF